MIMIFPRANSYIQGLNINNADELDKVVKKLLEDEVAYERAWKALRRRFVRGALTVDGVDRGGRKTKIKREGTNGKYNYFIEGTDGSWNEPDERIWVVAMYALWQTSK